jgi:hypothetical protein
MGRCFSQRNKRPGTRKSRARELDLGLDPNFGGLNRYVPEVSQDLKGQGRALPTAMDDSMDEVAPTL